MRSQIGQSGCSGLYAYRQRLVRRTTCDRERQVILAWIESHTVLLRHRKVLLLASDLALPPVYVIGHLHALWHAVIEQQEDGDLSEWPDLMIAQAAAYTDDAAHFVKSLQARKFLDVKVIHDWIEYAGLFLTRKYSTVNPAKLHAIWKLHGCKYGKRDNKSLHRIANRKRTESELSANLPNQPNQPNQPNLTTAHASHAPTVRDECDEFTDAYPEDRRVSRKAIRKAWDKAKDRPPIAQILAALDACKKSAQWNKDDGQFIPLATTWINQGRWDVVPRKQTKTTMEAFLEREGNHVGSTAVFDTTGISEGVDDLNHSTVGQDLQGHHREGGGAPVT